MCDWQTRTPQWWVRVDICPGWADLCGGEEFIKGGWMAVSDKPGIGVELDPTVAKTLLAHGDTYFD